MMIAQDAPRWSQGDSAARSATPGLALPHVLKDTSSRGPFPWDAPKFFGGPALAFFLQKQPEVVFTDEGILARNKDIVGKLQKP